MQTKLPDDYPALMPMLAFDDAVAAIEWYRNAFGAIETARLTDPEGEIGYAALKIGGGTISVSKVYPGYNNTPKSLGGATVVLNLYVDDADTFFAHAIACGATETLPVKDQFYGDRSGRLEDPFGHIWIISTVNEVLSVEEMQKRFDAECQKTSM